MKDETNPSTGTISVLSRSSTILSDRVREEQLLGLMGEKGVKWQGAFMHLRKNLNAGVVHPLVKEEKGNIFFRPFISLFKNVKPMVKFLTKMEKIFTDFTKGETKFKTEKFGVDPKVQNLLSHVRTDLDSFTDVEAYSLMLDGYLMSKTELKKLYKVVKNEDDETKINIKKTWNFEEIKPWISNTKNDFYIKQLGVAQELFFKVFRLSLTLKITSFALLFFSLYLFGSDLVTYFKEFFAQTITYGKIALTLFGAVIAIFPKVSEIFKLLKFIRSPLNFFLRFNGRVSLALLAPSLLALHLLIFDNLFLWLGKVKRLGDPPVG